MASDNEITVTVWDVHRFRVAPGDAHMIWDGAVVRVVPRASVAAYPGSFVIVSHGWLSVEDPDMDAYPPDCVAAFLTAAARHMADDRDLWRGAIGGRP